MFHSCRRGDVLVSRQSMIGVSSEGPYHMNYTGSPTERIQNVSPSDSCQIQCLTHMSHTSLS